MKLPGAVRFEQAASLPLAYGTAYRMLVTRGRMKAGEKVLVLGAAGGVGTGCVLLARQTGCEVIACASSQEKLDKLTAIGADHVINYQARNFREAVHEVAGKPCVLGTGGVDLAVNYSGGKTWKDTLRCLRSGGRSNGASPAATRRCRSTGAKWASETDRYGMRFSSSRRPCTLSFWAFAVWLPGG